MWLCLSACLPARLWLSEGWQTRGQGRVPRGAWETPRRLTSSRPGAALFPPARPPASSPPGSRGGDATLAAAESGPRRGPRGSRPRRLSYARRAREADGADRWASAAQAWTGTSRGRTSAHGRADAQARAAPRTALTPRTGSVHGGSPRGSRPPSPAGCGRGGAGSARYSGKENVREVDTTETTRSQRRRNRSLSSSPRSPNLLPSINGG